MQVVTDSAYENLYKTAMDGIAFKVAMQSIRKILRNNKMNDEQKLGQIVAVVHSFEKDLEKGE